MMRLNLHVIQFDLADLELQGRIRTPELELGLAYPQLCTTWPSSPSPEALYLVEARSLPEAPPRYGRLSIVCLGEPPEAWRRSMHSLIWTARDVELADVLNRISYLFWRYGHWEHELRTVAERDLPITRAAEVTQPLFANPFAALSMSYRMIFTSFPEVENPTDGYLRYRDAIAYDSPYMSDEDVVKVAGSRQMDAIRTSETPTLFHSDAYDYDTLVYTVRVANEPIAYLCMDEVLSPLTPRDRALWKHFGDFLGRRLETSDLYSLTHPEVVQEVLNGLVAHQLLPEDEINRALAHFGWHANDTFVTMAIAIREESDEATALEPLAMSIARSTSSDCYVLHDGLVCFVFDLTSMGVTRDELIELIGPLLEPLWLDASVSCVFNDFKNLYYYYQQALTSGQIGWRRDPQRSVHRFEDNAVAYILARLTEMHEPTIAETLVPDGLKLLLANDAEKGTEHAHLLDVYLRNERNIAKTIRQEYIHRNTFNYRLRRIEEISGLDLDDEDVRLRLLIAFRLLEREQTHSEFGSQGRLPA